MKNSVALIGGSGYLGSYLIPKLRNAGFDVLCLTHQRELEKTWGCRIERVLAFDDEQIGSILKEEKVETLINLICRYESNDISSISLAESNFLTPLHFLEIAIASGVKTCINLGTSLPDDFNAYTASKAAFRHFGIYFAKKYGIQFFNIKSEMFYGPNEPKNRFISRCLEQLRVGETLQLTEGIQKRDILHVDDLTGFICCLLKQKFETRRSLDIPVGTGEGPTIREIILYMANLLQSRSKICFGAIPMRPGEPDCIADTTIMKQLGFSATIGWKDGIKRLIGKD